MTKKAAKPKPKKTPKPMTVEEAAREQVWASAKQLLEELMLRASERSDYDQQVLKVLDAIVKELDDVRERLKKLEQEK